MKTCGGGPPSGRPSSRAIPAFAGRSRRWCRGRSEGSSREPTPGKQTRFSIGGPVCSGNGCVYRRGGVAWPGGPRDRSTGRRVIITGRGPGDRGADRGAAARAWRARRAARPRARAARRGRRALRRRALARVRRRRPGAGGRRGRRSGRGARRARRRDRQRRHRRADDAGRRRRRGLGPDVAVNLAGTYNLIRAAGPHVEPPRRLLPADLLARRGRAPAADVRLLRVEGGGRVARRLAADRAAAVRRARSASPTTPSSTRT